MMLYESNWFAEWTNTLMCVDGVGSCENSLLKGFLFFLKSSLALTNPDVTSWFVYSRVELCGDGGMCEEFCSGIWGVGCGRGEKGDVR